MGRRLASYVHVNDHHGRRHVFGPDDDVPDWAAAKITNPNAWATEPETAQAESEDTSTPRGAMPPKTGSGSGREVWAAYATVRGIQFERDATRDQIIAAVEAAEQQ